MKVLVTGGSGFLGTHVLDLLAERGHTAVALARSEAAAGVVAAHSAEPAFGDLDDAESIDRVFSSSGADTLVNVASLGFGHGPAIVAAAEEAGIKRAVFVSTTALFTNLNAPSKAIRTAAEDGIRASSLAWTIIRPTMIYGTAGDRNMWRLLGLLRRTPIVPLPGAGNLHQPVHVADLAAAIVAAAERPTTAGRAYDVAGPEPLPLRRVVEQAAHALGRRVIAVPMPARPLIALLGLIERTGRRVPISAEQVARLTEDKAFDISEAVADLSYAPRSFAEGIARESKLVT